MFPEQSDLASRIFADALELPVAERDGFVRARCLDNEDLSSSVFLLLSQHARLGDFLNVPAFLPAASAAGFQPEELLGGRFRILRCLGRGGMGEVYEAEDTLLRETVALKAVRPQWRGEDSFDRRFHDEIRLARKIGHINVCRIFDVFTEQRGLEDISYFTMEFLDGETLARRLARGPFSPDAAFSIAAQIAAGLDAAHALGIIHRDLKPANILLVWGVHASGGEASNSKASNSKASERAVITDFGLAKALRTAPPATPENAPHAGAPATEHLTLAGQILGSPDYMAPEQFLESDVTPATDIFALAVVVHEMLTGQRPFPSESALRSAIRRLTVPVEPVSLSASGLPAASRFAIARALSKKPEDRFSSASEFVAALSSAPAAPAPTASRNFGLLSQGPARLLRNPRKPLAIAAGLIVLLAAAYGFRRTLGRELNVPAGSGILLTPVQNFSGDQRFDALNVMLRQQVAQSAHLTVLPDEVTRSTLALMRKPANSRLDEVMAREVALRNHLPLVVYGNLSRTGPDYALTMRMEVTGDRPVFSGKSWRRTFYASDSRTLASSVEEASRWIRQMAGEASIPLDRQQRPAEQVTTFSWEALQDYQKAAEQISSGAPDLALGLLAEAIRTDPNFALAEMRTADLLSSMRREAEADPHYQRAMQLAAAGHLTRREELLLKGNYYSDRGSYAEAEQVLREFTVEYPEEYRASFLLANVYRMRGKLRKSIDEFQRAEKKSPGSPQVLLNLAMCYLINGDYEELDRVASRMDLENGAYERAAADFLRGRTSDALRVFESLSRSKNPDIRSRAFGRWAQALAEAGHLPEAVAVLRRGVADDEMSGDAGRGTEKQLSLAFLLFRSGRGGEARTLSLDAVSGNPSLRQLTKAGEILAWAGFLPDARRVLEELPKTFDSPRLRNAILRVEGEIFLADGDTARALAKFEDLNRSEAPLFNRLYLARAYRAAGEPARAAERCDSARLKPGLFWQYADYELPAILDYACKAVII